MMWPLHKWTDKFGISASTHRSASLGSTSWGTSGTDLGRLREFVRRLDAWPDSARVEQTSGAVLEVSFFSDADPMTTEPTERGEKP